LHKVGLLKKLGIFDLASVLIIHFGTHIESSKGLLSIDINSCAQSVSLVPFQNPKVNDDNPKGE
jgi:hypothetical protein